MKSFNIDNCVVSYLRELLVYHRYIDTIYLISPQISFYFLMFINIAFINKTWSNILSILIERFQKIHCKYTKTYIKQSNMRDILESLVKSRIRNLLSIPAIKRINKMCKTNGTRCVNFILTLISWKTMYWLLLKTEAFVF